jgi:hypothetical protein
MKAIALIAGCACLGVLAGCTSVAATRAKAPSHVGVYAGEYKAFSTCATNKIIERQVTTVIFDDPNKTATISTWFSDAYGRHLMAEGTVVQSEAGKVKAEIRSVIDKTIWGTVPEPTKQVIDAFEACGKPIS